MIVDTSRQRVKRTAEECCTHLLFEIVITACNDWLLCRERDWRPSDIKGKWPNIADVIDLRAFFSEGWCDRLLELAGSNLSADRILQALEAKPRMELSRRKQADRTSETHMLIGDDKEIITTGEADPVHHNLTTVYAACTAWLEKHEDGYQKRIWNDLDFRERQSKHKRQTTQTQTQIQTQTKTNESTDI